MPDLYNIAQAGGLNNESNEDWSFYFRTPESKRLDAKPVGRKAGYHTKYDKPTLIQNYKRNKGLM